MEQLAATQAKHEQLASGLSASLDQTAAQLERERAAWKEQSAAAQAKHEQHAAGLGASLDQTAAQLAGHARQIEALRAELKQREDSLRESQGRYEQEKNQLGAELARACAQREQAENAAVANQAAQVGKISKNNSPVPQPKRRRAPTRSSPSTTSWRRSATPWPPNWPDTRNKRKRSAVNATV